MTAFELLVPRHWRSNWAARCCLAKIQQFREDTALGLLRDGALRLYLLRLEGKSFPTLYCLPSGESGAAGAVRSGVCRIRRRHASDGSCDGAGGEGRSCVEVRLSSGQEPMISLGLPESDQLPIRAAGSSIWARSSSHITGWNSISALVV